jgi:hypothetical protein
MDTRDEQNPPDTVEVSRGIDAECGEISPEELTETAETRSFLRDLRAERNARIARDAMVTTCLALLLGVTVAAGLSRPQLLATAQRPSDVSLVGEARILETAVSRPPSNHIDGPLRREDVEGALSQEQDRISRCFELAPADEGAPSSVVKLAFLVSEHGRVLDVADLGSSANNRAVVRCVARSMRSLTLPAQPDGGRTIVTRAFEDPRRGA